MTIQVSTRQLQKWHEECEYRQRLRSVPKHESPAEQKKRIERARADYAYFVETYFCDTARCACGKFQIQAANYLKQNPNTRAVFEWARGHAKSTHLGVFIPLWLKIQVPSPNREGLSRSINTVVVVSKSQDAAIKLLSDLQEQLAYNELYIRDFGEQVKAGSWTEGEFVTQDDTFFIALGRGQSPRGLKHKGNRPDYIVIDDIDDDEMARNPRRVNEIAEWCLTALLGTMAMGRGRFVLVGNRIAKTSVLTHIAARPHFYHTIVNALDKHGKPTWAENYTADEIRELRETMGERNFQKEYMNNPMTEGAVFSQKNIRYGKMLPPKEYRQLICYTDPSFKNSNTADFKATMLVGKTPEGQFHLLKAYADQTSVSNMIAWHYAIMDYIEGRVPVLYYMEANFMQDLMLDEFRQVGNTLGNHVPILGDSRKKPDKFARIEAMQPLFERNLVVFNEKEKDTPGMQVLVEQLLLFERGSRAHDDAPDALESAIWMLSQRSRQSNARYVIGTRANRRF
ncbi:MAG: phage terminase large subunit [Bacteroidales bacterium]|jgi:predicted phage terminase large subunit-like protein|nr:phage terminase large subunit [Bacteroidales bacterium]